MEVYLDNSATTRCLPEVAALDEQMNADVKQLIEYARMALGGEDTSAKAEALKEQNLVRTIWRATRTERDTMVFVVNFCIKIPPLQPLTTKKVSV